MNEHINEFLETFKKLWEQYPNMRFGQLIYKLIRAMPYTEQYFDNALYGISDKSIMEFLKDRE